MPDFVATRIVRKHGKPIQVADIPCRWCGEPFIGCVWKKHQRYCGPDCRVQAQRSRRARALRDAFMLSVHPEPNTGCWLWGGVCAPDGYGILKVRGRSVRAHRVAYELFVGPIPAGLQACHSCDVRGCVNPAHLWLGTNLDNRRDSVQKRRHPHGLRCHSAKLTPALVREIRDAPDEVTHLELAERYGVSNVSISKIRRRITWKHVA